MAFKPRSSIQSSVDTKNWYIARTGAVTQKATKTFTTFQETLTGTSGSSPRVDGSLKLRANACNLSKVVLRQGSITWLERGSIIGYTQQMGYSIPTVEVRRYAYVPSTYLPVVPAFDTGPLITAAGAGFREKAAEHKAQLANTLLELGKTIDSFADTVYDLADAYRLFRKGNYQGAARKLGLQLIPPPPPKRRKRKGAHDSDGDKTLKDRWLEWRYAWGPLYYDLHGYLTAMESFAHIPKDLSFRTAGDATYSSRPISGLIQNFIVTKQRCTVKVKGSVSLADATIRKAHELGVTPLSAASSIWEWVPLSFVWDWFLPVGDFLAQFSALDGLTLTDPSYTINVYTEQSVSTVVSPSALAQNYRQCGQGRATRVTRSKVRILGLPPIELGEFKGNPFGVTGYPLMRALDAISLWGGLWNGLHNRANRLSRKPLQHTRDADGILHTS